MPMRNRPGGKLDWLTQRPIAHRGLHDAARQCDENSHGAIVAAFRAGFAIEIDLQRTADNVPIIFHDGNLKRLCGVDVAVADHPWREISQYRLRLSNETLWKFEALRDVAPADIPVIVEIKSDLHRPVSAEFIANIISSARKMAGPVALCSFDPRYLYLIRKLAPDIIWGIIAENQQDVHRTTKESIIAGIIRRHILHFPRIRPHFISYSCQDLPTFGVGMLRKFLSLPVLTWTVRSREEWNRVREHADQMIFENFDPLAPN